MRQEFSTLTSFDQINLGATILQCAVIVAFAVAMAGVWRTSHRPLARSLVRYWALFAVASVVNIGSSWSGAVLHDRALSLALTTIVVGLHGAAIAYAYRAIRQLAVPDAEPHAAQSALWSGATALLVHGAGVLALYRLWPDARLEIVLWSRTVHFLVLLTPALLAWPALRTAGQHRAAALLLAIGWTALALRALIEIGFGFAVGRAALPVEVIVLAIVVNVLAMMALGVTSLLAATNEEYGVLVRQTELLQRTQQRLARVERVESLGRLAGGIAHDFNNVLSIVQLAATDAAVTPHADDRRVALEEIARASDRGRDLVKQLLNFSKPQNEQIECFDASAHVEDMTRMFARLAGAVDVAFEPAAEPMRVCIDRSQFDQVLLNLIANARDAISGAGRITVSVARVAHTAAGHDADASHDAPTPHVRLRVADTGSGIAPDVLPHVFEPFFTNKADRGTGLGLATVQSIVHRAGGDITVRSEPGRGTTFDVLLPERA